MIGIAVDIFSSKRACGPHLDSYNQSLLGNIVHSNIPVFVLPDHQALVSVKVRLTEQHFFRPLLIDSHGGNDDVNLIGGQLLNQDVKIHVHDFQFPLIVFSYFLD